MIQIRVERTFHLPCQNPLDFLLHPLIEREREKGRERDFLP